MKALIAAALAVITLSIPASAGCHIVAFNTLVCDPNISALRGLIPNVQVRMGPPPVFPAAPPIVEAHYLMEACSSPDKIRQAGCAGFVSGVADSYAYTGQYCLPPDKAAVEQSVIEYITRIPLQGLSATNMVLEALRTQWPCGRRR